MSTLLSEITVTIEDLLPAGGEVTPRTHITVHGPYGAARAVIWQYGGQMLGVIGLHGVMPQYEGQQPQECDAMHGHCYDGDGTFRGGMLAAELYFTGRRDAAVAEVESWYRARLDPEGSRG